MSDHYESKIGILILLDIVNFTQQASKYGDTKLKGLFKKIETQINDISGKMGIYFIKSIGDAFLLFIDGIDIPKMKLFLEFVSELREKSIQGILDFEDFIGDLRCVAHFGNFQFKVEDEKIIDLQSVEGIIVFRIEKEAGRYEVVITGPLFDLIKGILEEKEIDYILAGKRTLENFSDQPILLYKLIFPGKDLLSGSLEQKLKTLEVECQTIPVFGGLYPAISMEKNFINLSIKGAMKPDYHYTDIDKRKKIQETLEVEHKKKKLERMREHYRHIFNAEELYETYNRGVIFGLPGAGKTTTLRYFAYKDFLVNRDMPDKEKKRVILFFYCYSACSYDQWFKMTKQKLEPDLDDIESILAFFTYHFLFSKKELFLLSENERKEFYKAEKTVIKAYKQGCLTLLMDGLDECENHQIKESSITLYRRLFRDFSGTDNKIFLTSRYSEKEDFPDETIECVFDICSLDMEQLREMARYFYKNEPTLYQRFDEVVWKEEIAAKLGGTPITAILLLTYFREFQRLESRFNMYDVLIKFIFIKTWKQVKQSRYDGNIVKKFIKEAASGDVFKENKDLLSLYDAVTLLAYDYIQLQESTMTQSSILNTFKQISGDKEKADIWFEDLVKENLLLHVGRSEHDEEYIFIHSTVMEYLAARFIIERIKSTGSSNLKGAFEKELPLEESLKKMEQRFFELETLPIAAGSSLDNGFLVLGLQRRVIQSYKSEPFREAVYKCAYKSLAEVERNIRRELDRIRVPRQQAEIKDKVRKNQTDLHWIYTYLKVKVLNSTEEQLKWDMDAFKNVSRLSLPVFLNDYLTYSAYSAGDYAIKALRLEFLYAIINREVLDTWLKSNEDKEVEKSLEKEKEQLDKADGNLLRFDSRGYNPEDKNFNYYQQNIGNLLAGFLGSPNLRHNSKVTCAAILPDGKHIISGSSDKTIKCWEVSTGKEVRTFKGHNDRITSLAVTPDGKNIISGSDDKTIALWDQESGKVIKIFRGHDESITCLSITNDGTHIISGSDDYTLKLWDLSTGKEIRTFKGHTHYVNCVSVTPDNKYMISGSSDRTLKLWDLESGEEIRTFKGHTDYVNCAAVTPDGQHMISGSSDRTLKLWEISSRKEIRTFAGHDAPVTGVSITPDGKQMISTADDRTLKLWNLSTGDEIRSFGGHNYFVNCLSADADGKDIISGADDLNIKFWQLSDGQEIMGFKGHLHHVKCLSITSNGKHLISASSDHTLKMWDLSCGKEIRSFKGHSGCVNCVSVTPDNRHMISGADDRILKLWELATGKEIRSFKGHASYVNCLSITPDGEHMISGSDDLTLKLWNLNDGKEIREFRGHLSPLCDVLVTLDEKHIISASSDKTLKLWNMANGEDIRDYTGHTNDVICISVLPDRKHMISGSDDCTLRLWDLFTGETIRIFAGHTNYVRCLAITSDGKYMVSGSYDMTLKIWVVRTGECIRTVYLSWIPMDIKPIPGKPQWFTAANRNATIAIFDFTSILD
jgi:WD40 repeat protein